MTKADQLAADRVLKAACKRAVEILREPVASREFFEGRVAHGSERRRARAEQVMLDAGNAVAVLLDGAA